MEMIIRTDYRFLDFIFRRSFVREELNGIFDVIRSRPALQLTMAPRSLVQADTKRQKVLNGNRGQFRAVLVRKGAEG